MLSLTWDGGGEMRVYCGVVTSVRAIQRAGESFFESYERTSPVTNPETTSSCGSFSETGEKKNLEFKKPKVKRIPSKFKKLQAMGNLYELFGLPNYSSIDDVKTRYKKMVLTLHPDKHAVTESPPGEPRKEIDEVDASEKTSRYISLSEAYEFLSNAGNKMLYDSTLPFDDDIPILKEGEDFFQVFQPTFERWAPWSTIPEVPSLGDASSSIEDVNKFYSFWFSFSSWRDFASEDEHDEDAAECREERRQLEKMNLKLRQERKNKETSRIGDIVSLAYKLDPRVTKEKQRQRDLKTEKKRIKYERNRKEKQKQALEEENKRKQLGESFRTPVSMISDVISSDVELQNIRVLLEGHCSEQTISEVEEYYTTAESRHKKVILRMLRTGNISEVEDFIRGERQQAGLNSWKTEDLMLLAQAVQRFPGGTLNRWSKISSFVGKNEKELREKMKAMSDFKAPACPATDSSQANYDSWSTEQQSQLENGLTRHKIPDYPNAQQRWIQISTLVQGKTPKQCYERYRAIRAALNEKNKVSSKGV